LEIVNNSLMNNTASSGGGGIDNKGIVTITNSGISGNSVTGVSNGGGGIANRSFGQFSLTDCSVLNNTAHTGGVIYSISAFGSSITNTSIHQNSATQAGGVFVQFEGGLSMFNSKIFDNIATSDGGGVVNFSKLNIAKCILERNKSNASGGAIYNGVELTITDSTLSENVATFDGGGIFASGKSTVIMKSTLNGNIANRTGGSIYNKTNMTISNSTLSGNASNDDGGGIYNLGGSTLTLTNCTITANRADRDGDNFGDGGGVLSSGDGTGSGKVILFNTLVSGNFKGLGSNTSDFKGPFDASSGINIFGGVPLGPLANNGGPTQTHALLPGSPAINAGNNTTGVATTDQRGLPRIVDGTVDIGAFEVQVPPAVLVGSPEFGAGADVGSGQVTLFNQDGSPRYTITPFAGFTGGVRTTAADFNGDGVADLVAGTGPGRSTSLRIFDGKTQAELFTMDPFEASFKGGIYVATGDLTGDGTPDFAISPDEGGGPRVRVFDGKTFTQIADFFGIDDPNFRGGARAALSDLSGDGKADLLVAAGFGGGPRLALYNGATLTSTGGPKFVGDFFVFEQSLRNGVFLSAGDVNGDGFADVMVGGGPGGGPRVFGLSGKDLTTTGTQTQVANFFAGDPNSRGGVRLTMKNLDSDAYSDIVVGSGAGAGSRVIGYRGGQVPTNGTPTALAFDFDAFPGFSNGVFVG
jgi:hypothetical protein